MKTISISLLLTALGLLQTPGSTPVSVFLGPIPSVDGFVTPTKRFEDSYRDLRSAFKKNNDFAKVIRFVDAPLDAQLVLEIVDRGVADTGMRTGSAVKTGERTAVATSVPVRTKQLGARLAVRGSDYRLDIDGAAGVRMRSYRNQAENVLKQLVEWVAVNRSRFVQ